MDVYAASEEGLGLAYIQPLTSVSGGAMLLYPSLTEAALPQVWKPLNQSSYPGCQVLMPALDIDVRVFMSLACRGCAVRQPIALPKYCDSMLSDNFTADAMPGCCDNMQFGGVLMAGAVAVQHLPCQLQCRALRCWKTALPICINPPAYIALDTPLAATHVVHHQHAQAGSAPMLVQQQSSSPDLLDDG